MDRYCKNCCSSNINTFIYDVNCLMTKCLSYRNQSIDLQGKSVDWFLYDRELNVFKHGNEMKIERLYGLH